jgi:hypothetical protein
MKKICVVLLVLFSVQGYSQQPSVILHVQTQDTLVYKSIVNQVSNIKKEMPDARIEVVCHGPGIGFLLIKNSAYVNKLHHLNLKEVSLVGCEYTMKQRNIKREELVSYAVTVPSGIVEILKKEQEHWLYVKLGF